MSLLKHTEDIVAQRDARKSSFNNMSIYLSTVNRTLQYVLGLEDNPIWDSLLTESKSRNLWDEILRGAQTLYTKTSSAISPDGIFTLAFHRASRNYVNIGAVGITREGKSELIARTTELGEWLLPRRVASQPCTTAPINIINGASKDGKKNFVRIHYFTVSELVALLKNNVVELGGDGNIISDDIANKAELRVWLKNNQTRVENHLAQRIQSADLSKKNAFIEGYFTHAKEYVNLLKENNDSGLPYVDKSIEEINAGGEVGEFYYSSVCYYPYPKAPQSAKTYKSFATKKAEIYTSFDVAGEPVENIQFLDTPGIGEQKVGLERSLSDTIAMNLDVILVVKSVRNEMNNQDTNRNTLVTLLRDRLNGKNHAKDSIFFLMNMWEDASSEQGDEEIKSLRDSLTSLYSSEEIRLSNNQFRKINIVGQYELKGEQVLNDNPVGRYLHDILSSLVPKIQNIDTDYFGLAESLYDEIKKEYVALKSKMQELANNLPTGDISERVDSVLGELNSCLDKEIAADKTIDGGIKYSIGQFCEKNAGVVLAQTIGASSKGVTDIDEYRQVVAYCEPLFGQFSQHYRKAGYLGFMDFQEYGDLKIKLCNMVESEIYRHIDTQKAERELLEIKKKIASVFINNGMLAFVSSDPSTWWQNMTDILKRENADSKLVEIFENVGNFTIDYKAAMRDKMTEILRKCKHCDNFGDPESFNFQEYRNAVIAIAHSLLYIEKEIKDSTEEEVIRKKLASLMETFDEALGNLIRAVSFTKAQKPTEERIAMVRFYKRHADEIFRDDDYNKKIALVSSWREHIK